MSIVFCHIAEENDLTIFFVVIRVFSKNIEDIPRDFAFSRWLWWLNYRLARESGIFKIFYQIQDAVWAGANALEWIK